MIGALSLLLQAGRQSARQARTRTAAVRRRTGPRYPSGPQYRPHTGIIQEAAEIQQPAGVVPPPAVSLYFRRSADNHQAAGVVPPPAFSVPGTCHQLPRSPIRLATSGEAQIITRLPASCLRRLHQALARHLPGTSLISGGRRYSSPLHSLPCRQPAAGG